MTDPGEPPWVLYAVAVEVFMLAVASGRIWPYGWLIMWLSMNGVFALVTLCLAAFFLTIDDYPDED